MWKIMLPDNEDISQTINRIAASECFIIEEGGEGGLAARDSAQILLSLLLLVGILTHCLWEWTAIKNIQNQDRIISNNFLNGQRKF